MGVKHYDKAFKEQAVKLSQQRDNINAVARELGISSSQLSKWCSDMKTYKERSFLGRGVERLTDEQRETKKMVLSEKIRKYFNDCQQLYGSPPLIPTPV